MAGDRTPPDLELGYYRAAGSVPPPGHDELEIRLRVSGEGEVAYWPDYPGPGTVPWRGRFPVDTEELVAVYRLIEAAGVLVAEDPEPAETAIGGPVEWVTVIADGRRFTLRRESDHLRNAVFRAAADTIRSWVPHDLWDELERWSVPPDEEGPGAP